MCKKIILLALLLIPLFLSAQTKFEITNVTRSAAKAGNMIWNGNEANRYDNNEIPMVRFVITVTGLPATSLDDVHIEVIHGKSKQIYRIVDKQKSQIIAYIPCVTKQIRLSVQYNDTRYQTTIESFDKRSNLLFQHNECGLDEKSVAVIEESLSEERISILNPNIEYTIQTEFSTTEIQTSSKLCFITINTEPKSATVDVKNALCRNGVWSANQGWIEYTVKQDNYYPETKKIRVNQEEKTINVTLKPICGRLTITSTPAGAKLKIYNRNTRKTTYTNTPLNDTTLQIGQYDIEITKKYCRSHKESVIIKENKKSNISCILQTGDDVEITSDPSGAQVYINNNRIGTTPCSYRMQFGEKYTVKVRQNGGETSKTIDFNEYHDLNISFKVAAQLSVSPTSYNFSREGEQKIFTINTPFQNWSYSKSNNWLDINQRSNTLVVRAKENRTYDSRSGRIEVKVANKTEYIDVTQSGKFRKSTDDFSGVFLEYDLGYQVKAKAPTLGLNFSYIPEGAGGHLGFYVNPNYGFDNTFIGAAGIITRWTHSQIDYSKYNKFDFQLYAGAAYKTDFTQGGDLTERFGGDIGIRLTGEDPEGSRFGFYSATLGAKVFKNEIIPTIGFSTGLLGSALIFRDGRINESAYGYSSYNYPRWFLEFVAGLGANTCYGFWGVGATLAYVPSSMGVYFTGMGGNGFSLTGGPSWRIIPEDLGSDFDLQFYSGVGYNSAMTGNGFIFDVGLRLSGNQLGGKADWGNDFAKWSATFGTQVSLNGEVVPTFGISVGVTTDFFKYLYKYFFQYYLYVFYGWVVGYQTWWLI